MNKIFYKSLSNLDINKLNQDRYFRGCFMRDELINLTPLTNESGVLNLDTSDNRGTHWTCWIKKKKLILYFDSFGLIPPPEIINYFKKLKNYNGIFYNTTIVQPNNSVICGHLCLYIINNKPNNLSKFKSLIINLIK